MRAMAVGGDCGVRCSSSHLNGGKCYPISMLTIFIRRHAYIYTTHVHIHTHNARHTVSLLAVMNFSLSKQE